jgi:hypothetical protein
MTNKEAIIFNQNAILDFVNRRGTVNLKSFQELGYDSESAGVIILELKRRGVIVGSEQYRGLLLGDSSESYHLSRRGKEMLVADFGYESINLERIL